MKDKKMSAEEKKELEKLSVDEMLKVLTEQPKTHSPIIRQTEHAPVTANKKELSNRVMEVVCQFTINHHSAFYKKHKQKIDSAELEREVTLLQSQQDLLVVEENLEEIERNLCLRIR